MEIFTGMVTDFIFYNAEVKATAIVIAISSSVCCSVVWILLNIINSMCPLDETEPNILHSVTKADLKFKNSFVHRRNSVPPSRTSSKDAFIARQNSFTSVVPVSLSHRRYSFIVTSSAESKRSNISCYRCQVNVADKVCPQFFCETCCNANVQTVCQFHQKTFCKGRENQTDKPRQIDLSHLNLSSCPERVGFMGHQLTSLDLSNNRLHSLPVEIGCLMGLQQLYLQHNDLKQLPVIIRNLIQLQELYLDHNKLTKLTRAMGDLNKLKVLSVCHNKLCEVPGDLGRLQHLVTLRLSYNHIESIPDDMCSLPKLKNLHLKKNVLSCLPERICEMIRLFELDVSHNDLGMLPQNLTKCAFMARIKCSHNRLKLLPSHLHRLQHLKYLNVCSNLLNYFPASLHGLKLQVLEAHNNPLWKEKEVLTNSRSRKEKEVPELTELAALYIVSAGIVWRNQNLPLVLQDLLESADHCSCCERPLLDACQSRLEFYNLITLHRVPLHQKICLPYTGKACKFMPLVSNM